MSNNDLERMINQMADFYRPYPRDEGIKGIAEHITLFWEPRMRKELQQLVRAGGAGLSELALEGAKLSMAEAA